LKEEMEQEGGIHALSVHVSHCPPSPFSIAGEKLAVFRGHVYFLLG